MWLAWKNGASPMQFYFRTFVYVLGVSLFCGTASALTLDWDAVAWSSGTLTNSYDVDPAKAGNDITVTASGNTAQFSVSLVAPNPLTPVVSTAFGGGLTPAQKTLELAVDFTSQAQFITLTIDFSALYTQGVQNVSFAIFDVDFRNDPANSIQFQDQLRSISALSIDGVTQLAPTITTSTTNSKTGTGLSQVVNGNSTATDTGASSGAGNVTISFGTNAIKSLTFTYASGSGTIANPTYQHIGLHDISFTPVPEINPGWSAVASCLAAAGLVLHHRSLLRKK